MIGQASTSLASYRTLLCILSGPGDLSVFRLSKNSLTWSMFTLIELEVN